MEGLYMTNADELDGISKVGEGYYPQGVLQT